MTLTGKQKRSLRALAHHIKPVVQIGDAGVTPALIDKIDTELGFHEIIKVKLNQNNDLKAKNVANDLASGSDSTVFLVIGRTVGLYRPFPEEPEIRLP